MDRRVIEPPAIVTLDDILRVRPYIEAALRYSHGTHLFEDVVVELINQRAQLWPFEKSALVTEINVFPRKKVLNMWLAGGNMRELLSKEPGVVAWGKRQGCETSVLFGGRKGWIRSMSHLGYRPLHYTIYRDI